MPTLKEIASRIKAVSAIKDTTEAMKMIAQARVAKAEQRLNYCRTFSADIEKAFKLACAAGPADAEADPRTQILALGTDQGLCGSINSGMARAVQSRITAFPKDAKYTIFPFGNRLISNLQAKMENKLSGAVFGSQKTMTFRQALAVTDILLQDIPTTRTILYNKRLNAASFVVDEISLPNRHGLDKAEEGVYDIEGGNEVLSDFYDYHQAVLNWRLFSEVETSELSSRAMAMTNSTSAAADMQFTLKLVYSKLRQEQITTEIIEISTGATQTLKANAKA